jgi:hypothetical protein
MRRYASEHRIINELETQVQRYKEERNFWKRMACPGLVGDPSEWSEGEEGAEGDIPEEQKRRLAGLIAKREEMGHILGSAPGES